MQKCMWVRGVLLGLAILLVSGFRVYGSDDGHLVGLGVGAVGIADDHKVIFGSVEYRPDLSFYLLRPWLKCDFGDGLVYTAAGLLVDFMITDRVVLTPSLGVGLHTEDGGADLGHEVEFQSALELGYRFNSAVRVGAAVGHISNSGIGDTNPGTELLKITVFVPLGAN